MLLLNFPFFSFSIYNLVKRKNTSVFFTKYLMKGGGELLFSHSWSSSRAPKQEEGLLGTLNEFHFKLKTFYVLLF